MANLISDINSFTKDSSDDIFAQKKKIRRYIRELKAALSEDQKREDAREVFRKIEFLPDFQQAETIFIYWSTPDELPTHAIIEKWNRSKQLFLPSIVGNDMHLKLYSPQRKMKQGLLNIWEPESDEIYEGKMDLVIVPGIAFDTKKNRLGRGKGFYDRYFNQSKTYKIGIGFDFQLFESIPVSACDIGMDKIITPSYVID